MNGEVIQAFANTVGPDHTSKIMALWDMWELYSVKEMILKAKYQSGHDTSTKEWNDNLSNKHMVESEILFILKQPK